ncbi:MAG: hypothetical protein O7E50_03130 [Gemmatimonadetes bacterium]|nr:hypothetical protein [Gemmatimonadota bacterium]
MAFLNGLLSRVFDLLLAPFRGLPPVVGLLVLSLLTSVGMLLLFKVTSNQDRLSVVKRRMQAGIYEIRLFKDDLRSIFRSQMEITGHTLNYLRLSLVPMLWMIVPLFLVLVQLQFRFGYAALEPGRETIVKATFGEGFLAAVGPGDPHVELGVPPGLRINAPRLWIPSLREVDWRIVVLEPGVHTLRIDVRGESFEKVVDASGGLVRRSPVRPSSSFMGQLLYPAEAPLPRAAPVESITIEYPELRVSLFGWKTHWLVAFLIFTLIFSFALRTPLKVTI